MAERWGRPSRISLAVGAAVAVIGIGLTLAAPTFLHPAGWGMVVLAVLFLIGYLFWEASRDARQSPLKGLRVNAGLPGIAHANLLAPDLAISQTIGLTTTATPLDAAAALPAAHPGVVIEYRGVEITNRNNDPVSVSFRLKIRTADGTGTIEIEDRAWDLNPGRFLTGPLNIPAHHTIRGNFAFWLAPWTAIRSGHVFGNDFPAIDIIGIEIVDHETGDTVAVPGSGHPYAPPTPSS